MSESAPQTSLAGSTNFYAPQGYGDPARRTHTFGVLFNGGAGDGSGQGNQGAGAGAGQGQGQGTGAGQGQGGTGSGDGQGAGAGTGAGQGQGGSAQHLTFSDPNQLVQFPGMDKPMRYSDYQRQFISRTDYDRQMKPLLTLAQLIDQKKRGGGQGDGQGQGQGQGGQRRPSRLDTLREQVVVGGGDIAELVEELQQQSLGPMANALGLILKELKGVKGHVGTFAEERNSREFTNKIGAAVKTLPLPQTEQAIPGAEVLHDILENLYLAHNDDPNDPGALDREFPEMAKKQFDALRKYFREVEKAELTAADGRRRKMLFTRPGAGGSGNGGQQQRPRTNAESARMLFRGGEQTT